MYALLSGVALFFLVACGSDIEPQMQEETKPGELSLQKLIIALKANKKSGKNAGRKT